MLANSNGHYLSVRLRACARRLSAILAAAVCLSLLHGPARATEDADVQDVQAVQPIVKTPKASPFVRPAELEPAVGFWRRVYTEAGTDGGFIHDNEKLDIVYEVLNFPPDLSPSRRSDKIETAKLKYTHILQQLATGDDESLAPEAQRVRDLWPKGTSRYTFRDAADRVRFQLGQANRFREGLIRSGTWMPRIASTLERMGLPRELAALPHVESSFNTNAYSKVGAAGMWQFMRSTGRRYLRIDNTVDERLDPYKATEAAAKFLEQNYAVLGTWPLALTAYNHGAAGMLRARDQVGTDDITVIIRKYDSPSFGFASRNYYPAFLAAVEIDSNPDRFFGPIRRNAPDASQIVVLPDYIPIRSIVSASGVDVERIRQLNPSLLPPVWSGARHLPRGYALRLPETTNVTAALDRMSTGVHFDAQAADTRISDARPPRTGHRVRKGESLASIARRYKIAVTRLASLNGLRKPYKVHSGQVLALSTDNATPAAQTELVAVTASSAPTTVHAVPPPAETRAATDKVGATNVGTAQTAAVVTSGVGAGVPTNPPANGRAPAATGGVTGGGASASTTTALVTSKQAPATAGRSSAVVPSKGPVLASASSPYSTGTSMSGAAMPDDRYAVRRGDTLGKIATDHGLTETALMQLNNLRDHDFLYEGQILALTENSARQRPPEASVPVEPVATAQTAVPVKRAKEAEPVSRSEAEDLGPTLLPGAEAATSADPSDYAVAKDGSIRVEAAETLGHYADWLGVRATQLRQINRMSKATPVVIGRRVKLDFSHVERAAFEAKRTAYHKEIEEAFFAQYHIAGSDAHTVQRGESIWILAQKRYNVPIWLLRQYNPDVDFEDVKPGKRVVIPRIEAVAATTSAG